MPAVHGDQPADAAGEPAGVGQKHNHGDHGEQPADAGQRSGSSGSLQSVLSSCHDCSDNVIDHTELYTNVSCGPPLPDLMNKSETMAEIVQSATDGLIPVAAFVKMITGFDDIEERQQPIAVLLGGQVFQFQKS